MPDMESHLNSASKSPPAHDVTKPSKVLQPKRHAEQPEKPVDQTATLAEPETDSSEQRRATTPRPTSQQPTRQKAAASVESRARNEVSRGSEDSPKIALTFDAGWEYKPGGRILDVLAKHNVRATFFLTGRWVEKNPDLARRIAAEGHRIGNHTYSHRSLTKLSSAEIAEEAKKTEQLVLELTGRSTKPLLRVPYGARNKRVLSVLEELGYCSIYWDVDSRDAYKANITPAEIEQRVLSKVRNGSIVLMHIGSKATADALDSLLQKLVDAGYQPVTVSETLSD